MKSRRGRRSGRLSSRRWRKRSVNTLRSKTGNTKRHKKRSGNCESRRWNRRERQKGRQRGLTSLSSMTKGRQRFQSPAGQQQLQLRHMRVAGPQRQMPRKAKPSGSASRRRWSERRPRCSQTLLEPKLEVQLRLRRAAKRRSRPRLCGVRRQLSHPRSQKPRRRLLHARQHLLKRPLQRPQAAEWVARKARANLPAILRVRMVERAQLADARAQTPPRVLRKVRAASTRSGGGRSLMGNAQSRWRHSANCRSLHLVWKTRTHLPCTTTMPGSLRASL
mmetsp:Transcript_121077/g.220173  ORF Transcript_121077/g.220173 Transcript_121077/m.220173 type:complete len:277 (-) Transcript_121077:808-1638(-)